MKLVSFNIWGGTIYGPLMDYLRKLSATTDIFCFQEVFSSLPGAPKQSSGARMFLFEELLELLQSFSGFFDLRSKGYDFNGPVNFPASHGLAVFAKKDIGVLSTNSKLIGVVDDWTDKFVKAQILKLSFAGKILAVINFHGIAQPGDKQDTPERLDQARQLAGIWQSLGAGPKILCGDFNLEPETKSIGLLGAQARNLIKEFKIKTTRNQVSWDKHPQSAQKFADYTFVSPEVKVNSFEVPYNELSDHLPMVLEFTI